MFRINFMERRIFYGFSQTIFPIVLSTLKERFIVPLTTRLIR